MSKFLTPLKMELLDDNDGPLLSRDGRPLYRMLDDLVYHPDIKCDKLVIPKGFISDLASIPQITMSLFGDMMPEAFVLHDWLYNTAKFSRYMCDQLLKEACITTDIADWKVTLIYLGVRLGGSSHYATNKYF